MCDVVVVSVFVNPTQFGPDEDLARYPRRPRADAALCAKEGVDVLFTPSVEEMYPSGFQTWVSVSALARRWEGARRPGHFRGVATIVTKLLSLVRPSVAFFGQKDFQQAVVVKRLVADLNLGVRIIICPTVRDLDGLALSSRNVYLTSTERQAAPVLFRALEVGRAAVLAGVRSVPTILRRMRQVVASEPLARLDYLAVCDPDTLEPLARVSGRAVLLGAIRIGRVRLIDNVLVTGPSVGERHDHG
jgi:pantoate--beta-alanine ligase